MIISPLYQFFSRPQRRFCGYIVCPALLLVLGYTTVQACHKYKDIITLWQDTIVKNPRSYLAHNNLASIYTAGKDYKQALTYYSKALQIRPNDAPLYFNQGNALTWDGRYDEAVKSYSRSLEIKPHQARVLYNMGLTLMFQGKYIESIAAFKRSLILKANQKRGHLTIANLQVHLGHTKLAIQHLSEELTLDPGNALAHIKLGNLLEDFKQADLHFQQGLKLNYEVVSAYVEHRIGKHKKIPAEPIKARLIQILARAHLARQQYSRAEHLYKKWAVAFPAYTITSYYNIACLYGRRHKIETALIWLKKAADLGFNKWTLVEQDPDLEILKNLKEYEALKID